MSSIHSRSEAGSVLRLRSMAIESKFWGKPSALNAGFFLVLAEYGGRCFLGYREFGLPVIGHRVQVLERDSAVDRLLWLCRSAHVHRTLSPEVGDGWKLFRSGQRIT